MSRLAPMTSSRFLRCAFLNRLLTPLLALTLVVLAADGCSAGEGRTAVKSHAAGPTCNWYVSPQGSVRSGGRAQKHPTTLRYASRRTVPGDVVCLLAGIYRLRSMLEIRHGGRPDAWIVYRSYDRRATITAEEPIDQPLVYLAAPAAYVQFSGISFVGDRTDAYEAFLLKNGVHHIRILNNRISDMSAAGIATLSADYVTIVGNQISRFGDGKGWSSGISFNSNDGAYWHDAGPGFHNVICRNIITGGIDNSDYNSDGNGIILDLGNAIAPTLVANNVIYMNGGRGIVTVRTTGRAYIVNNTLYKNGLDLRMRDLGEAVAQGSSNQVWANNIAYAWAPRFTYQLLESSSNISYIHNAQFGGRGARVGSREIAGPAGITTIDPVFVNAPSVDPRSDEQWRRPPRPWTLATSLTLASKSPLVDTAVDPRMLPGLDPALASGMDAWALIAVDGTRRPVGRGFDYGAYER
jgi:hypothetical protein